MHDYYYSRKARKVTAVPRPIQFRQIFSSAAKPDGAIELAAGKPHCHSHRVSLSVRLPAECLQ